MKNLFTFTLFIVIASGMNVVAQYRDASMMADRYRAVHWSIDDGLPGDTFNWIIKDVKGFIWIGYLHGILSRFDGSRFRNFLPDPLKPGAIYSGDINELVEDSLHNIWIGHSKGLSRYDIQADTFSNFITQRTAKINDLAVYPFWTTSTDVFALEAGKYFVAYNIHSFVKRIVAQIPDSLSIGAINYSIVDTITQSIWILDGNFTKPDGGLIQISMINGESQRFGWPCYRKLPNHSHYSEGMRLDRKRNCIWINSPDGLMQFSLRNRQFKHIDAFNKWTGIKEYRAFTGIDIDSGGRIWLSINPVGIVLYKPETGEVTTLFSDSVMQQKTGLDNWQIYCDRDNIVWTTYWDFRGIYELVPYNPVVKRYTEKPGDPNSLNSDAVNSIVPDNHGQLWIGTDKGINILNVQEGKFHILNKENLPALKSNDVDIIGIDTLKQKVFFLTDQLYMMDMQTLQCRIVKLHTSSALVDTPNIEAILSQPYQNGFLVYDMKYGFFEVNADSLEAKQVIPFVGFVGRVGLAEDRWLFIKDPDSAYNYSFERVNDKWVRRADILDSLDWTNIYYDHSNQTYWVSLSDRLVHYDKDFHTIKNYTESETYTSGLYGILQDRHGNLWFANGIKQIATLDTATGIVNALTSADGYPPQYYSWFTATARDYSGQIYFMSTSLSAGGTALNQVNPESFVSIHPSYVYFSRLEINHSNPSLKIGIDNIESLSLSYKENNITIETGIIDYYSGGKSHLRYRLESSGKTEGWQYGSSNYVVRYEGLLPGDYKLIMQASNSGGEYNGPKKIVSIHISPPFWALWWFKVLAIITFAGLVYAIVQYRSRNLKKQNLLLEKKVEIRTLELNTSLNELKSTQAQLIQSEKMASLGELTAGIAHEIQNPLNFVNNFSDVNKELLEELRAEADKGNIQEVKSLAEDVINNEEKINHHGKRADAIVKGMLQHSRKSTGLKEPTDINALADEYLRLAYHGLRAREKSFKANVTTDYDITIGNINLIPQDIGRVLLNLYNNAFYAVSEKTKLRPESYEPTVSVTTKKIAYMIELRVRDNGNGVPLKVIDKIFQPFFTTKPSGQGTGLGLSLSYDIVKAQGGEIKVDTQEGEFTEFVVLLPLSS